MESKTLSDIEVRRYTNQLLLEEIGKEGQLKIKNAKVLVIGVGGLGTSVLTYLSAAGIGTLGICDNDLVSESNFHRQIIYGATDLGKQKAIVAKQKLQLFNSNVEYNIHNIFINDSNNNFLLKNYDIVVDCTDNLEARLSIDKASRELKVPMVYAGVYKFEGQISVFNYHMGISFSEFLTESVYPGEIQKASETGIIGVIPGIAGCIQANEVIKIITGKGEVLSGKLLYFNMNNNFFKLIEI